MNWFKESYTEKWLEIVDKNGHVLIMVPSYGGNVMFDLGSSDSTSVFGVLERKVEE